MPSGPLTDRPKQTARPFIIYCRKCGQSVGFTKTDDFGGNCKCLSDMEVTEVPGGCVFTFKEQPAPEPDTVPPTYKARNCHECSHMPRCPDRRKHLVRCTIFCPIGAVFTYDEADL